MSEAYNDNNKEENQEQEAVVEYPYSVAVKFRDSNKPYSFGAFDSNYKKGDWVVVETAQGIEMGYVEADALSIEKYKLAMPTKRVIRIATEDDHQDYLENDELEQTAYKVCVEEIESLGLDMNLLSAQYTLDRTKVLFVYLAEQRVDFRELLKRLGSRLHCRIELRQIGERDKAKMVGGIGMCGMECCCRRFKNHFDVISINMAKNQLLALNTEKLSGMCGKLMCCLKYEDDLYKELIDGLPKMGSQVEYEGEVYRITSMNVMNKEAKLENYDAVIFLTLDELREKAIPRKGVVMQRKNDGEEKKVIVRTPQQNNDVDVVRHVSMELPTMQLNTVKEPERRTDNNNKRGQNNRKNLHSRRRNINNDKKENKNITVRTFGKKKEN